MRLLRPTRISVLVMAATASVVSLARAIDRTRIWDENRSTVVRIISSGRTPDNRAISLFGTGVMLASGNEVLTAGHVVGGTSDWLEQPDGSLVRTVEVFALDKNGVQESLGVASVSTVPEFDLAILHLSAHDLPGVHLSTTRPNQAGSVVVICWKKDAGVPYPQTVDVQPTDIGRYGDVLTLQKDVEEGESGSPVFDDNGDLVAVITSKLPGVGAAATFLDRVSASRLPSRTGTLGPPSRCRAGTIQFVAQLSQLKVARDVCRSQSPRSTEAVSDADGIAGASHKLEWQVLDPPSAIPVALCKCYE